jgi:vacuolar-type H+-ATPase subunit E/Vma4
MSEPKRHQFPSAHKQPAERGAPAPANAPSWLEPRGAPNADVRTLVSLLQGDHPPPPPPPQARSIPEPPPAAAAPPPPSFHEPDPEGEPDPRALEVPDEVLGKLPAPPRLGSLLPGGRSRPPPANDRDEGLAERVQAFASAAIELSIARAATLAVLEGQLLDLAVEVAEAIIEKEVSADTTLHAALARAALQSLGDAKHVILRTSQEGFEAITAAFDGDEVDLRGVRVQIVSDPAIPGLGCVVDGDNVRVDATVNERLRAVRRAFEEERRRAQESVE